MNTTHPVVQPDALGFKVTGDPEGLLLDLLSQAFSPLTEGDLDEMFAPDGEGLAIEDTFVAGRIEAEEDVPLMLAADPPDWQGRELWVLASYQGRERGFVEGVFEGEVLRDVIRQTRQIVDRRPSLAKPSTAE